MKILMSMLILSSFIFAKECYFNKVNTVCYYKYFKKSNIDKAKADEEYYVDKKGKIYTFDKVIEVRFNSIGAVFTLKNDFQLEFVDKIKKDVYLFKVSDRRDLFSTISKINRLKTVMKAQPHRKRKYTKAYVKTELEKKRARFEAVMEKAKSSLNSKKSNNNTNRSSSGSTSGPGFNDVGSSGKGGGKSFLKGNAQ